MITDFKNRAVYITASDYDKPILTLPDLMKYYERIFLAPGDVLETADGQTYRNLDITNGKANLMAS